MFSRANKKKETTVEEEIEDAYQLGNSVYCLDLLVLNHAVSINKLQARDFYTRFQTLAHRFNIDVPEQFPDKASESELEESITHLVNYAQHRLFEKSKLLHSMCKTGVVLTNLSEVLERCTNSNKKYPRPTDSQITSAKDYVKLLAEAKGVDVSEEINSITNLENLKMIDIQRLNARLKKKLCHSEEVTPRTSSTSPVTDEERRWIVIGVCLNKVLTPALRNILASEIPKWYTNLCKPPTEIDKQVHGTHQRTLPPSTISLNYKNINNNNGHKKAVAFDYAVKDPLSLAKLFVKPFMCDFTGFDETMDTSVVLSLICEAAPFVGAVADAKEVRSDIRNVWAHCNFAEWTEEKFDTCFESMETLLKNVGLPTEDEKKLCDELNSWKDKGFKLSFGQSVDMEVFASLHDKVGKLCEQVEEFILEKSQVAIVLKRLRSNGARLARLIIDQGTEIFRNYFDSIHSPANLRASLNEHRETLKTLQREGVLNPARMELLFPRNGTEPVSTDFDITLLFILVRNICGLTSQAALLDGIKHYRDVVYGHKKSSEVNDEDFDTYWNEISDVLKRLSNGLGVDLSDNIEKLKTSPLDLADEDHYIGLLNDWHKNDQKINALLHRVETRLRERHCVVA